MNATTTAQTLMVNINDEYPLFRAVDFEDAVKLRETGEWASYFFKVMKYAVTGTTVTLYHFNPTDTNAVSPYFKPSTEMLEKMAECQALLTPARVLSEYLGLNQGVFFTTRNFDSATVRPRSVGIFSPVQNAQEVEGMVGTVIDLSRIDPHELEEYFEEDGQYPTGVDLHAFYAVERDHVVSFLQQIRRDLVE